MFGLFKKKSEIDKLYDQHKKLLKEAHKLSTTNRMRSDLVAAEADQLIERIKLLEDNELEEIRKANKDSSEVAPANSNEIKKAVHAGPLTKIRLFQANAAPIEIPEKDAWIFDGGIELQFDKAYFTIAWNTNMDCFDFYNKPFYDINESDIFYEIDIFPPLQKLIGLKVEDISIVEHDIKYVVDYTLKTESERGRIGAIVQFEDGKLLQTSMVDYDGSSENPDFIYEVGSELLISLGEIIPIKLD